MFEYLILGLFIGHFTSILIIDIIYKCKERKGREMEETKKWIDY